MFTCNCFSRTFLYRQSRTLLGRLESLNRSHTVAVQLNARSPTSYYTTASKLRGLQHAQSLLLKNVQSCRTLKTSFFLFDEYQIVHTPPFAESVTEGDVRWEKGIGDTVAVDEVIGEIETDKTALPIVSPAAGVIEELYVADGEKVEKGNKLFKLRVAVGSAKVAASPKADIPPKQEVAAKPPPPSKLAPPPSASPPQKPVAAAELSVSGPPPKHPPKVSPPPAQPIAVIKPSPPPPPKTAASPASVPSASSAPPAAAGASLVNQIIESKEAPTRVMGNRVEIKVKMNRMRQRIAQRLKDAQNVNAMLTTFNEVDMSKLMEMRNKYKDLFQKSHGVKLGFMSAFVKASSNALQQMPVVNAVIEDNFVVYRDFVDISVAVATPKGLVVPVLRNVHQMNFGQIELGMAELGEKARSGELAIEDMDGGTFTISNGGVFGSLMGTPIINPPQSAILGMHGIFDRPIAVDKKVEIRPMMYVALTYDHRLIDGREAVTFLRKVKQFVEDPQAMLLDV